MSARSRYRSQMRRARSIASASLIAEAVGENADLGAERVRLDEQGAVPTAAIRALAISLVALHEPRRRDGEPGGGGEREARELVLRQMRRGRRTAEPREAFEAGERRDRRAAVEADSVGQRPDDRLFAAGSEAREATPSKFVERDEFARRPSSPSASAISPE